MTTDITEMLHATYQRLVDRPVELDYLKRQMWGVWVVYCKHDPFTENDLELVVKYLKSKISKGERKPACVYFRNLIESPDWFQEARTDARAAGRLPKVNIGKQSVLRATGRLSQAQEQPTAVSAKAVLERPKLAAMLKEWKKTL